MIKSILKSKLLHQIIVLILILSTFFSVFTVTHGWYTVSAIDNSDRGNTWKYLTTEPSTLVDLEETIPGILEDKSISVRLPLDRVFGTNRFGVQYTGAVPENVKDSFSSLGSLPYEPAYSGATFTFTQVTNLEDFIDPNGVDENGNKKPFDLRIYTLYIAKSGTDLWLAFLNMLMMIFRFFAELFSKLISLLIFAKNINMTEVANAIGLKSLINLINTVFVGSEGSFSIFVIFAFVSFIFVLVGYAVTFIKAGNKKKGLFTYILPVFLIGLMFVFLATSNDGANSLNLGTKVSQIVESLIVSGANEAKGSGGGSELWKAEIPGVDGATRSIQIAEQSAINRPLIDITINSQFHLSKTDLENLYDEELIASLDASGKENILYPRASISSYKNLGYWWWMTDSPAKFSDKDMSIADQLTYTGANESALDYIKNKEYDDIHGNRRMNSLYNYLQAKYDKTGTSNEQKSQIIIIAQAFANPNPGWGFLNFLLLQIVYILLFLVLWKVALKVMVSKIIVAGSILGMPVGGILMMTAREKLVNAGKMVLLIWLTYSIQTIILSVLFDIILSVVAILIDGTTQSLLLVIALLIALLFAMPKLMAWLEKLFASMNSAIDSTGTLNSTITATKQWGRRNISKFNNWNDNRTIKKKVYDKEGNLLGETEVKAKGSLSSLMGHSIANSLMGSETRRSSLSLIREARIGRKGQKNSVKVQTQEMLRGDTRDKLNTFKEVEQNEKAKVFGVDEHGRERAHTVENVNAFAVDAKTRDLLTTYDDVKYMLKDAELPDELKKKVAEGVNLTEEEKQQVIQTQAAQQELESQKKYLEQKILENIDKEIQRTLNSTAGKDFKDALIKEIADSKDLLKKADTDTKRKLVEEITLAEKTLAEYNKGKKPDELRGIKLSQDEKLRAFEKYGVATASEKTTTRQRELVETKIGKQENEAKLEYDSWKYKHDKYEEEARRQAEESAKQKAIDLRNQAAEDTPKNLSSYKDHIIKSAEKSTTSKSLSDTNAIERLKHIESKLERIVETEKNALMEENKTRVASGKEKLDVEKLLNERIEHHVALAEREKAFIKGNDIPSAREKGKEAGKAMKEKLDAITASGEKGKETLQIAPGYKANEAFEALKELRTNGVKLTEAQLKNIKLNEGTSLERQAFTEAQIKQLIETRVKGSFTPAFKSSASAPSSSKDTRTSTPTSGGESSSGKGGNNPSPPGGNSPTPVVRTETKVVTERVKETPRAEDTFEKSTNATFDEKAAEKWLNENSSKFINANKSTGNNDAKTVVEKETTIVEKEIQKVTEKETVHKETLHKETVNKETIIEKMVDKESISDAASKTAKALKEEQQQDTSFEDKQPTSPAKESTFENNSDSKDKPKKKSKSGGFFRRKKEE